MSNVDEIAGELEEALGRRVVAALEKLGWSDLCEEARLRLPGVARTLALQLCSEDERVARGTAKVLAGVAWDAEPEPEWWRSSLGRVVARALADEDTAAVTYATAAAMLGVQRGTVAQLMHRGELERAPGGRGSGGRPRGTGQVRRASVLRRLARRSQG